MLRRRLLQIGLSMAVVVATAACDVQVGEGGFSLDLAAGRAQDSWTRSYPLAQGGRLELINVNGRIDAEPASGSTVELVGQRTARAGSDDAARELLGKVEMREEVGERGVRVEVRAPRTFGVSNVEVRWTVKVPKGTIVDLRTINGRVALSGLDGEVHARTVNGGVEGKRLAVAALDASTVNGGVDIELTAPLAGEGSVALEAVNGGVSLALPGDSRASVTARVTNGGIRTTDLDLQLTGEQSRRRLEGTLNGGGTRVSLQTTNGGVRLSKSGSGSAESATDEK
ncbi:MAG: DUF4097 family beta strand repeat-containing protein [Vicinamibacterales bacterium]